MYVEDFSLNFSKKKIENCDLKMQLKYYISIVYERGTLISLETLHTRFIPVYVAGKTVINILCLEYTPNFNSVCEYPQKQ